MTRRPSCPKPLYAPLFVLNGRERFGQTALEYRCCRLAPGTGVQGPQLHHRPRRTGFSHAVSGRSRRHLLIPSTVPAFRSACVLCWPPFGLTTVIQLGLSIPLTP